MTTHNDFETLLKESGIKDSRFIEELASKKASKTFAAKTWRKKREDPSSFSVEEVKIIAELLKIKPIELFNLILKGYTTVS